MQIYLGVEKFGKIKSANVNINSYTIFVGNNNSGKTYLMQLIYGVFDYLSNYNVPITKELSEYIECSSENSNFKVNSESLLKVEECVNKFLNDNKKRIIYYIFRNDISIERLFLKFVLDKYEEYEIRITENNSEEFIKELQENNENNLPKDKVQILIDFITQFNKDHKTYKLETYRNDLLNESIKKIGSIVDFFVFNNQSVLDTIMQSVLDLSNNPMKKDLFLPASRSGLLLLYRDFFAENSDNIFKCTNKNQRDHRANNYGLTTPVYNFMRFLQTHKSGTRNIKRNSKIIKFIEENIIEGKLSEDNEGVFYIPNNKDKVKVPLYLTSSMVNELTPVIWALSDESRINRIIFDEIETSLHPAKQVEVVRLLNRLNNRGIKLIISTHSDTMAVKLNNLLLLSLSNLDREKKLNIFNKLNLTEEDMLNRGNKVYVYQFTNQEDGLSIVEEINFQEYTGYNFDMFTETVINLYNESQTIMEL